MTWRKNLRRRVAGVLKDQLPTWESLLEFDAIAEGGKYFVVRTGSSTYNFDSAWGQTEQYAHIDATVNIDVVVGHVTEGFDEEIEDRYDDALDEMEVALYRAFCLDSAGLEISGHDLISTDYPTRPDYLAPGGMTLQSNTGIGMRMITGIAQKQAGTQFTLNVPVLQDIEGA